MAFKSRDPERVYSMVLWVQYGNVSANTVDNYLVHLNGIESFLGFKKFDNSKKYTKSLLKGFKNAKNLKNKKNSKTKKS